MNADATPERPADAGAPPSALAPSQAATEAHSDGTAGHRRGPNGYRCCKHCREDIVHDVPTDGHDGPCGTCDDPGAMLREQVANLERALADERAKVARVEALAKAVIAAWDDHAATEPCSDCLKSGVALVSFDDDERIDHAVDDLRAALAGPEPEATESSYAYCTECGGVQMDAAGAHLLSCSRWAPAGPEATEGGDR